MKYRRTRLTATALAVSATLLVTACSSDGDEDSSPTSSATAAPTTSAAQVVLPTAAELGDLLHRAVDPALPPEEKAPTVEDGEQAAELFDVITRAVQDSGATFAVVDPVLPGVNPDQVKATATLTLPEQEPIVVKDATFVRQNDAWKISRAWSCTLVGQVAPDQVPAFCQPDAPAPAPEGDPAAQNPDQPQDAPVPPPAPEPAPEAAPAPAPAGDPGIRDALLGAGVDQATADKLAENPDATVAAAVRMGIPQSTADQFRSNPQGAIEALRAAGIDPVTAAPQLAAQL